MAVHKLTADQQRRVEEIQGFQRTADHLKHLVTELDSNRGGQTRTIEQLCERIAKETAQLRQRALTANIGTVGDVAGAMSVMAGRGGGIHMKVRGLTDGVNSLLMQLEQALKHAMTPAEPKKPA